MISLLSDADARVAAFSSVLIAMATVERANGEPCDNPAGESSKDGSPIWFNTCDITQRVLSRPVGLRGSPADFLRSGLRFHLNLLLQKRPTRDLTIE